jgi:hypothetical protein
MQFHEYVIALQLELCTILYLRPQAIEYIAQSDDGFISFDKSPKYANITFSDNDWTLFLTFQSMNL